MRLSMLSRKTPVTSISQMIWVPRWSTKLSAKKGEMMTSDDGGVHNQEMKPYRSESQDKDIIGRISNQITG